MMQLYSMCVFVCARVTEERFRVDVQGATGWAARLAARPGARYRSRGLLSDQPAHHHHTGKHTCIPTIIQCDHVFHRLLFMVTEVDAGGKCPCCSDDWRGPTRSNHTDGIVRDGEASQQVCVPISLRHKRLISLKSSLLHVVGFERLWWNLGKSIVECRTTTTGSTSTICWPPLATASSSSKKGQVLEKLN